MVVVEGPTRTVYVGGQDSVDASGNIVGKGDVAAQTEQVLANVRAALAAGGAGPEHVIKWNLLVVEGVSLRRGFSAFPTRVGRHAEPAGDHHGLRRGVGEPGFPGGDGRHRRRASVSPAAAKRAIAVPKITGRAMPLGFAVVTENSTA